MSEELKIIAPDKRIHRERIYDLTAKCFTRHGYWNWIEYCRNAYFEHSFYDWNASRIGMIGEKVVTHCGVWDYQMRIGTARVRVGGIGGVATDGEYRRRGFMGLTALATVEAMREPSYDMTILFGLRNFYHRFGYVRAWARTTYFVDASELTSERPSGKLRKITPRMRSEIDALYNREYARYTGTAVRPTYLRNPYPKQWEGYWWANSAGKVAGYVIAFRKDRTLNCIETGGEVDQVLRALAALAKRWGCEELIYSGVPYDHPLARRLRSGNCRTETRYVRSGNAMIRTLNLRSTLTKMSGELGRRVKESAFATWGGDLLIADPREKVTLRIGRGRVDVLPKPSVRPRHTIRGAEHIAQLLIGTHCPEEIVEAGRIRLTGDAKKLTGILFPDQHPTLGGWDYF